MVRSGLSEALLRLGILGLVETRRCLALRYLNPGTLGIEIGALHVPLPLPREARAWYVDHHARETLQQLRPDAAAQIVRPDILANGFHLRCIASGSQDFVIANHVLEHATDALGTLENWLRALRPGGVVFMAVPRGERCFDRGRAITSRGHFLDDYLLSAGGKRDRMSERNRLHVEEYLAFSAPAIARDQGATWVPPRGDERNHLIARLLGPESSNIHHHVFSRGSFAELLELAARLPEMKVRIECIRLSSVEIVGVLRRLA